MIIKNQEDVTRAVLAEAARAPDARFREILSAGIRHLHAFAREARLTESEFHQLCGVIARLGQATTASHNEVVLAAGSLGLSSLVCLLNNGDGGQTETANLMGPFWRMGRRRPPAAGPSCGLPRRAIRCSSRPGCATVKAARSKAPRLMYGTVRPKASTRTRIRRRAT